MTRRGRVLAFADESEFADLSLQCGHHFLGGPLTDTPEAFQPLQIVGFDGIGNISYRQREGLDRLKRADGFHGYEQLEKLFFRFQIKADQNRFWLTLGLMEVNVEGQFVSDIFRF